MADSTDKKLKPCMLPRERMVSVRNGAECHTGRAMSIFIAGEPVIIVAADLAKLDKVFNYTQAHMHAGKVEMMATLRTDACPKVVIAAQRDFQFDDEL